MASFTFVGTVSVPKDTDKFHSFEITESRKGNGWLMIHNRFTVSERDSRHFVSIDGGKYKDGSGKIFITPEEGKTLPKCVEHSVTRDGKESYSVKYEDRKNPEVLSIIGRSQKKILDLNPKTLRYMLKSIGEKLEHGDSLNPDELKALNAESMADAKAAYDKACRRKMEFLDTFDFAEMVKKAFDNGAFNGKKVRVSGTLDCSYSEAKDRFYENYKVNSIEVMDPEDEEYGHLNVKFYYGAGAVTESDEKLVIRGHHITFVGKPLSKRVPKDIGFVFPITETNKKIADGLKSRFEVLSEDEIKARSVVLDVIDGSPRIEITDDMLTPEQKEDLEYGFVTREALAREFGEDLRGERITELRFVKWGMGGTVAEDTAYKPDQMIFVNPNVLTPEETANSQETKPDTAQDGETSQNSQTEDEDLNLW